MKKLAMALTVVLALALVAGAALGEGLPNSKATVQVKDKQIFGYSTVQPWETILQQRIKTANDKSVLANVSLVCGLYTFTKVASKDGIGDTQYASATINVRACLVPVGGGDPIYLEPNGGKGNSDNGIVFSHRLQQLSAKFAGYFDGTTTTDEEVSLLLETLDANSFNFVAVTVPQGTYDLKVQAKIASTRSATVNTVAEAKALINEGSVTIEEVRLIKDPTDEYVIE